LHFRAFLFSEPRYLFPPNFRKSQVVFNLHRAAGEAARWAIVVEGFFDCLEKPEDMRGVGALGGLARARNLRLHKAREVPVARETSRPREETAGEAIRRNDALCPWLVGVEQWLASRNDIAALILEPTGATFGQIPTTGETRGGCAS
jgi:hypothetical protein